jgi:dethiobiotin synthetase
MIRGHFITGVSTAVGKTFVTRGLARAVQRVAAPGRAPVAIKPIETGLEADAGDGDAGDALALARACGRPELARTPGLYRAALPLAPFAVTLETRTAPPDVDQLVARIRELARAGDHLLVEGAGGLLVPLDAQRDVADLAAALQLPLLVVARDELGVLSSVLTCVESARARSLVVAAVVLSTFGSRDDDPSPRTNRRILETRLALPVVPFPRCEDDDDALAGAAERCGLLAVCTG